MTATSNEIKRVWVEFDVPLNTQIISENSNWNCNQISNNQEKIHKTKLLIPRQTNWSQKHAHET